MQELTNDERRIIQAEIAELSARHLLNEPNLLKYYKNILLNLKENGKNESKPRATHRNT